MQVTVLNTPPAWRPIHMKKNRFNNSLPNVILKGAQLIEITSEKTKRRKYDNNQIFSVRERK